MWYVIFLRFQDIYISLIVSRVTGFYLFFFLFFGLLVSTFGIFVWTFSNILFEYFFFGLFRRRTNDRQNTNARNTNSGRVENGEEVQGGTTTTTVENHKTGILQVIFSSFNRTRNKT